MDEIYNKTILIETDFGSFDDRVTELIDNFPPLENKRVKIINAPSDDSNIFEDMINNFIMDNCTRYKIIDIKYIPNSVLIIYESISSR